MDYSVLPDWEDARTPEDAGLSIELRFRSWTITNAVLVWRVGLLLWERKGVFVIIATWRACMQ